MSELTDLLKQDDFVTATIVQINKDLLGLSTSNVDVVVFSSGSILDNLIAQLSPILKDLMNRQSEQLSQFIYRVDLGENRYFDSLHKDPTLVDLANQIIEREAQKVFLRKQFSK